LGSVENGRIRKWIEEHSLPPPHWYKLCQQCNNFEWECADDGKLQKRFCKKWREMVNPEAWACFYFAFRLSKRELREKRKEWEWAELMGWLRWQPEAVRESYFGAKWFKYRPEVCDNPSHRREFFRKVYDLNDNSCSRPTFCSKRCEREFYSFLKEIRRNSHLMNRNLRSSDPVARKNPAFIVYSLEVSWGAQIAAGPKLLMRIIIPTHIVLFNRAGFLATHCWLFLVDESGRCLHSVFVASDD